MSDLPPPPGWGTPPPQQPPQPPGWGQPPPPPGGGWGAPPPPPPPAGGWGTPPPPPGSYGQPYGGYAPPAPRASFWTRLGAYLIDLIIVGLFSIPAIVTVAVGPKHWSACTVNDRPAECKVPDAGVVVVALLLGLAALIAAFAYFAILDGRGQTIGRRATGIRVLDANTGQPLGTGRALGRTLFRQTISGWICWLGFLWMLWDPDKQAWHDKVVSSVVVPASVVPPPPPQAYAPPPASPWS